ncbi:transporter substrate-binding domain-containing protein [Microbulbifer sp. OS29]|uniref:Transporter substrate-binding domain-containing protein n=1 Tax=Microbulbifer okhotskensis TaxID=2926617 RepID=A0A9X2EQP3_9GAMM|nr:transporter substrate-binding domain-containing protein [Microbulbifer okhotskensis]MCO1336025.1 transporter substrate-binding domain-containing protein [Microbulbifer okhotskensis]
MRRKLLPIIFLLLTPVLLFSGCEQAEIPVAKSEGNLAETTQTAEPSMAASQQQAPQKPAFENYIELGDLAALRKRGRLRLLSLRGPLESALPREGLPMNEWRQLAQKFAHSRGLRPQWVYVDNFAELIPALIEGRGDVIATNFSRTEERKALLAFTRPLEYVSELLITRRATDIQDQPLQVALRRGSAFAETLSQGAATQSYEVTYLDGSVDNETLLGAISAGQYPATIIDSNLAEALLPAYPQLVSSAELNSRRAIAWAVRRDSTVLRRELNEFFTAELVLASQNRKQPLRNWLEVKESGTLRVLTRNHPASYFIWRGELMGFDYDLLKKFARDHKLRLSMVVPDPDMDLAEALQAGMGDMVAASLTITEARRQQGLEVSRPYMKQHFGQFHAAIAP